MNRIIFCTLLGLNFVFLSACSTFRKVNDGNLKKLTHVEAEAMLATILQENVNEAGFVNFKNIQKHPQDLRSYINYVQNHGPQSQHLEFRDRSKRMAYYLNSYNALSMYNVVESGLPESNSGLKKIRFFGLTKFTIDGQIRSLSGYENNLIRKLGDPRIHFSLNCMSYGCPKFLNKPYSAKNIEKELEDGARAFFADEKHFRVDQEKKTIFVSEILDFFPEDFLVEFLDLRQYIAQYTSVAMPAEFKIKFIPYDWRILHQ